MGVSPPEPERMLHKSYGVDNPIFSWSIQLVLSPSFFQLSHLLWYWWAEVKIRMRRVIQDEKSWEFGLAYGMIRGISRYLDKYFEYMKAEFTEKLIQIHDLDLAEKLNDKIYSKYRSRDDFELVLNTIKLLQRTDGRKREEQ
jgi:hypothetical protein